MDTQKMKAFAGQVFSDMAGAMTAGMAYLGTETGLFQNMAGKGPLRLDEVIGVSGLQPRYVEEWLKGMVAAGYLKYVPEDETFELPDEHAFLVASEGTDHFVGGLFHFAPVLLQVAPKVAEAFRTGGGVPFGHYGPEGIAALDMINRGQYEHRLSSEWLPAITDMANRLASGARITLCQESVLLSPDSYVQGLVGPPQGHSSSRTTPWQTGAVVHGRKVRDAR